MLSPETIEPQVNPKARLPEMGPLAATVARKKNAPKFIKTLKQIEACKLMAENKHTMLFGGSRSGKTFIALRQIVLRAVKKTSRHLVIRHRFSSAKRTIVHDTFPEVMRLCFPGIDYTYHALDAFYTIPNVEGGISTIWIAGIDSKERTEKILGTEFSTIYINESSEVPWEGVTTLWTRLAETSGLSLRMIYDCNPPGVKHWSYKLFMDGLLPTDEPWTQHDVSCNIRLNPSDNLQNLPDDYVDMLKALPKRQRERFLEGKWLSDIEGALWTDLDIVRARALEPGEIVRTVIAVDPAVSDTSGSDECGIIVASIDSNGNGIIEADLSGKMSTRAWAQVVVEAYHAYMCNEVVIETNQGGDLCLDVLRNVKGGNGMKIVKVHAARGKQARAEPVQALYEEREDDPCRISHIESFPKLEQELTEWVPTGTNASPNRLDALCWGITHLMLKNTMKRVRIGRRR